MALRQNTSLTNIGVTLPNAYHRVIHVVVDVPRARTVIEAEVYADQAARDGGAEAVRRVSFTKEETLPITGMGNPQVYAYTHLKTLPEFAGAVDV